jgi:homospermidine synthase
MGISKVLMVGFGSIGQALAPLLLTHWNLSPSQVSALAADADGAELAASLEIDFKVNPIVPANLDRVLSAALGAGDLLINVSVRVSSMALIEWCQAHGVLYLDTCVEPWDGGYLLKDGRTQADTTNYALREAVLAMRGKGKSTAVIAHGANPGLISHLAKAGLLEMAAHRGLSLPEGPNAWARLSQDLGIQVVQIAERDTQYSSFEAKGTFVNTWSVDGLLAEARQSAECGWGTHEKELPRGSRRHVFGCQSGIYLDEHGVSVRVQSWVPNGGAQSAYLITHHEALSLSDLLTVPDVSGDVSRAAYRPTVYYAYNPCEQTRWSLDAWVASNFAEPQSKRVLRDELVSGEDQLGAFFVFKGGAYWYGTTVKLDEARWVSPSCNATSLQVIGGILGALDWMLANPFEGVVEAEDMPHQEILDVAKPYLGRVQGHWTAWQPEDRSSLNQPAGLQFSAFRI